MKKIGTFLSRRSFTLIEMLVVMGVIALLMAILIPTVAGGLEKGRISYCANNLSQIGKAITMYASDNKDYFPAISKDSSVSWWDVQLLPYLGDATNVFVCPSDPYRSSGSALRSYAANGIPSAYANHMVPFGYYAQNPTGPLRMSDLDSSKGDIILVGERPGDGDANNGEVGVFAFCGLDFIKSTIHQGGKGGNYLMGSMAVKYIPTNDATLNIDASLAGNMWAVVPP